MGPAAPRAVTGSAFGAGGCPQEIQRRMSRMACGEPASEQIEPVLSGLGLVCRRQIGTSGEVCQSDLLRVESLRLGQGGGEVIADVSLLERRDAVAVGAIVAQEGLAPPRFAGSNPAGGFARSCRGAADFRFGNLWMHL